MATYNKTKIVRCEVCGAGFVTNHRTARYCSNRCKQEAYRRRKNAQKEARALQMSLPW